MAGRGTSPNWRDHWREQRERILIAMDRQGMSTRQVVMQAKAKGLKISVGTCAEFMTGKVPASDRVVAAYAVILGIHPDDLGFHRYDLTELGYLAYEAIFPDAHVTGGRRGGIRAA